MGPGFAGVPGHVHPRSGPGVGLVRAAVGCQAGRSQRPSQRRTRCDREVRLHSRERRAHGPAGYARAGGGSAGDGATAGQPGVPRAAGRHRGQHTPVDRGRPTDGGRVGHAERSTPVGSQARRPRQRHTTIVLVHKRLPETSAYSPKLAQDIAYVVLEASSAEEASGAHNPEKGIDPPRSLGWQSGDRLVVLVEGLADADLQRLVDQPRTKRRIPNILNGFGRFLVRRSSVRAPRGPPVFVLVGASTPTNTAKTMGIIPPNAADLVDEFGGARARALVAVRHAIYRDRATDFHVRHDCRADE